MTLSWRFTRPLVLLRVSWYRAFTCDDEDRDIITAGLRFAFLKGVLGDLMQCILGMRRSQKSAHPRRSHGRP
jgi:hypothetical protein